ncbi:MAG TPA: hypothetical protein VL171_15345 [Verrucomicrobiae bacterium]|nr:hypothetical protein [Verrucomicrobiae bacterium]
MAHVSLLELISAGFWAMLPARDILMMTEALIQAVWERGEVVLGHDPGRWRKDRCGAWMSRDSYENRESDFGWVADRINVTEPDSLTNLRPLQWRNGVDKRDGRLACYITAVGTENIDANK